MATTKKTLVLGIVVLIIVAGGAYLAIRHRNGGSSGAAPEKMVSDTVATLSFSHPESWQNLPAADAATPREVSPILAIPPRPAAQPGKKPANIPAPASSTKTVGPAPVAASGPSASTNLLRFRVAQLPADLSVETGLETTTLVAIKNNIGNTPWREVAVAGEPNGIEVGGGAAPSQADAYLRFEFYNDALAAAGKRIVVTVTGFDEEQLAHLQSASFDPYSLLTQQDLDALRAVVATARLAS